MLSAKGKQSKCNFQNKETFSYIYVMVVVEVSTGTIQHVEVIPVDWADYTNLTKSRYAFNWREEKIHEVYKLTLKGQKDVLGLISIERIPSEWRIHIRLLTVSHENRGKGKRYDGIAGNLIAHVARLAVADYAELACVSLRPKTAIAQHYIDTYGMRVTGSTLSLEMPEILDLIQTYDRDE